MARDFMGYRDALTYTIRMVTKAVVGPVITVLMISGGMAASVAVAKQHAYNMWRVMCVGRASACARVHVRVRARVCVRVFVHAGDVGLVRAL